MGCVVIQILWLTQGGNCMANKEYKSDVFSMLLQDKKHQQGHGAAKFLFDLLGRDMGVFQRVVQQPGEDEFLRRALCSEQLRHLKGMDQIGYLGSLSLLLPVLGHLLGFQA